MGYQTALLIQVAKAGRLRILSIGACATVFLGSFRRHFSAFLKIKFYNALTKHLTIYNNMPERSRRSAIIILLKSGGGARLSHIITVRPFSRSQTCQNRFMLHCLQLCCTLPTAQILSEKSDTTRTTGSVCPA